MKDGGERKTAYQQPGEEGERQSGNTQNTAAIIRQGEVVVGGVGPPPLCSMRNMPIGSQACSVRSHQVTL